MARLGAFDGEIGRGRQRNGNDSSSSRDSSPVRNAPKRSFSPLSDDGDVVIQPTGDPDLTPPPADSERPLLRKAVAFASEQPVTGQVISTQAPISTYEANVNVHALAQPKKTQLHFLPGQEVPLPSRTKNNAGTGTGGSASVFGNGNARRNKTGVKRPRRPDAYPGQTTRFRLDTYDPTPSADPPIAHGTGPYASLYRGVAPPSSAKKAAPVGGSGGGSGRDVGAPQVGGGQRQDSPAAHSTHSNGTYHGSSTTSSTSNRAAPPPRNNPQTSARPDTNTQSVPSTTTAKTAASSSPQKQKSVPSSSLPSTPNGSRSPPPDHSTFVTDTNLTVIKPSSPGPYYRRNYEERDLTPPLQSWRPSTGHSNSNSKSSSSDTPSQKKNTKGPLRVVTLLIDDVRSGTTDQQLAEVKIPLRKSDDPDQGWWADAKDIAEQLQCGPSRIDGPSRAFTMRGKYRQFILRVSAENKDEIVSANVAISPEKTLDLVVETLFPPGAPPRPAPIPRDSWGPSYDEYDRRSEDRMDVAEPVRQVSEPSSRKRLPSPSFDDYDSYPIRGGAPSHPGSSKVSRHDRVWEKSPRHDSPPYGNGHGHHSIHSSMDMDRDPPSSSSSSSWRRHSLSNDHPSAYSSGYRHANGPASPSPLRSPPLLAGPGQLPPPSSQGPPPHLRIPQERTHAVPGPATVYPRRGTDDDSYSDAPPDEPFIRAVERLLKEDEGMCTSYFRAEAGTRASDIVQQFDSVTKMCMMWVGKRPPGFNQIIEESHIVRALEIDDPDDFLAKCQETVALLKLYGKKGRVHEDSRVVDMLNDLRPPPPGVDMGRKLLRLLRGLDDAWKNDLSGPILNGIMPLPHGRFEQPGRYGPHAPHEGPPPPSGQFTTKTSGPPPPGQQLPPTSSSSSSSMRGDGDAYENYPGPSLRTHSYSHSHSSTLSTSSSHPNSTSLPQHSASSEGAANADNGRYVARGKGMFVD